MEKISREIPPYDKNGVWDLMCYLSQKLHLSMYKGCSSYLGIILYLLDVFSIEEEHKTIKESPVIICASCKIKQANKYLLKPLLVTTIENNTKSTQETVRESIKIYNQSDEAKLYVIFIIIL